MTQLSIEDVMSADYSGSEYGNSPSIWVKANERQLPAITEAVSDKQRALAEVKINGVIVELFDAVRGTRRALAAQPAGTDAVKADQAMREEIAAWLAPRSAREWIDGADGVSRSTIQKSIAARYRAL